MLCWNRFFLRVAQISRNVVNYYEALLVYLFHFKGRDAVFSPSLVQKAFTQISASMENQIMDFFFKLSSSHVFSFCPTVSISISLFLSIRLLSTSSSSHSFSCLSFFYLPNPFLSLSVLLLPFFYLLNCLLLHNLSLHETFSPPPSFFSNISLSLTIAPLPPPIHC